MKKVLVSTLVVVGFISYSVYERLFGLKTLPLTTARTVSRVPTPTAQTVLSPSPTQTPFPTTQIVSQRAVPTDTPKPLPTATPMPKSNSLYKDGTYTGDAADAFYGNIQVQATISSGRITNVQFLQAPNDRGTSIEINQQADPQLAQEAIQSQGANVDIVSGATDSSQAFIKSMQSALDKAKA